LPVRRLVEGGSGMRKLKLSEWAALGEVIGTIAVFVSLMFVVYSINQNTAALQGSSENMLFEMHADLANHFISDASMAEILVKKRRGDTPLSEVESVRWEKYELNLLDMWAMAFTRHQRELLSDTQWKAWDDYFTGLFLSNGQQISREQWNELKYGFGDAFWSHVNRTLFD
jgi:hypothetical protein